MRENRGYKRADVEINARIVINGEVYAGSIKNVSESGLGYLITSSLPNPDMLTPLITAGISFQVPLGQVYTLSCRTVWFSKTLPHGKTFILGMKIMDPPHAYKEWIKGLI